MGENVIRPGKGARPKTEKSKSTPSKRKPLIKKGAVRLPKVSLECYRAIPPVGDTTFWEVFILPLKQAMKTRPRTFKELRDILNAFPELPKSKTTAFHLNALSYMHVKKIVVYSPETKLWRLRGEVINDLEVPTEQSVETLP